MIRHLAPLFFLPFMAFNPLHASQITSGPYQPDPSFNYGVDLVENFGSAYPTLNPNGQGAFIRRLLTLPNGDLVAIGVANPPQPQLQSNGFWNISLSRYTQNGQQLQWPDPSPEYSHSGSIPEHHYITYPRSSVARVRNVIDATISQSKIFIQFEEQYSSGDIDVAVLVFSMEGRFLSRTNVFTTNRKEFGGGLVYYENAAAFKVAVAGMRQEADGRYVPIFRRYTVDPSGTLTPDTGAVEVGDCVSSCTVAAIAQVPSSSAISPTSFYLAGASLNPLVNKWEYALTKIDDMGGTPGSSYGTKTFAIFEDGQWRSAQATQIQVTPTFSTTGTATHVVYLAGEVERTCRPGIGVLKLDASGNRITSFGDTGTAVLGGLRLPCNQYFGSLPASHVHRMKLLEGGRIGLAGYLKDPTSPAFDGLLGMVDATSGAALGLQRISLDHAYLSMHDLLDMGPNRIVVGGLHRYYDNSLYPFAIEGWHMGGLLGLQPASEELFADGFE